MAERRFGQLKVPELDSPRMIGAGTQFRRVPPYFNHCKAGMPWIILIMSRRECLSNVDSEILGSFFYLLEV